MEPYYRIENNIELEKQRPKLTDRIEGFTLYDNEKANVKIIFSEISHDGVFKEHVDNYDHKFLLLDGELIFKIDGEQVKLHQGSTLFIKSGVKHSYKNKSLEQARLITMNIHNS